MAGHEVSNRLFQEIADYLPNSGWSFSDSVESFVQKFCRERGIEIYPELTYVFEKIAGSFRRQEVRLRQAVNLFISHEGQGDSRLLCEKFCEENNANFSQLLFEVFKTEAAKFLNPASAWSIGLSPDMRQESARNSVLAYYLRGLKGFLKKDIETLKESVELTAGKIAHCIRRQAVTRGLVFGRVQSGKTAHMCGLLAALDRPMNSQGKIFITIILSGTMTNLCLQTLRRFQKSFAAISSVRPYYIGPGKIDKAEIEQKKSNVFILIKNAQNIKKLLQNKSSAIATVAAAQRVSLKDVNLLILDDEADQATPNVAKEADQQTATNKVITDFMSVHSGRLNSVTYVAYTATPYATLLNDAPDSDISVFPKDFMVSLRPSDCYWGSRVYFPESNEGCPLIIPYAGKIDTERSTALAEALAWFLSGAAYLRATSDVVRPVSFLLHESGKTAEHAELADEVREFLSVDNRTQLLHLCRYVWERERSRVTKKLIKEKINPEFADSFPGFDQLPDELPLFEEILPELADMLNREIKPFDLFSGSKKPVFTNEDGIHFCVDNSHEGADTRLNYPDDSQLAQLSKPPVFIVVGGNTLSRGLTIEGLTTTFFGRRAGTLDTQQQMGRWYGYPKERVLLVRVWIAQSEIPSFDALSVLESSLDSQIKANAEIPALLQSAKSVKQVTPKNKRHYSMNVTLQTTHETHTYRRDNYERFRDDFNASFACRSTTERLGIRPIFDASWEHDVRPLFEKLSEADGAGRLYLSCLDEIYSSKKYTGSWKVVFDGKAGKDSELISLINVAGLHKTTRSAEADPDDAANVVIDSLADGKVNRELANRYPDSPVLVVYDLQINIDNRREKLIGCSFVLPASFGQRVTVNQAWEI